MDLPSEVLLAIFSFLDHHRYFPPLLLVSRLFKSLAEPLLYCEVNFHDHSFARDYTPDIQRFSQTISSQPDRRLAKHVKSFLTFDITLIPEILPELPNLRRLDVSLVHSRDCEAFSEYFSPSAQLTHFRMAFLDDMATLKRFLELQPTLEYLDINDQPEIAPTIRLSPHALSRLRALGAGSDSIRSILPGRDIRHLTVHNMFDEGFANDTFPTVHTLRVHNYTFPKDLNTMVGAACHFPNVKYLAIDDYGESSNSRIVPSDIIPLLRPLSVTKVEYISLLLSRDIYIERQLGSPSIYPNDFTAWLGAIPTLRVLDVASDDPVLGYQALRFTAGVPMPVEISRPKEDFVNWSLWWEDRGLEDILA